MGKDIKYWKSLDELKETPEFLKSKGDEFAEQLPSDVFNGVAESSDITNTNRRDFLKFMGFSIGAAALAACEAPVTKTIPYVVKPEEITPGVANWYSSTYADGSDYCSILVKTREGRPIKIEGNKLSGVTRGGVSARVQGSLLSLYDKSRLRSAMANKGGAWSEITWKDADDAIGAGLNKAVADGKTIAILSSTILSPSTKQVIADFAAKYPAAKHVTYDAVSVSAIGKAHQNTHGKNMIPNYRFDNAKVIVSIGADFLVNWVSPIEYAGQYAVNRKVNKDKKDMSRHVQIESTLSVTGSNADYRLAVKPSQLGAAVVQLHNALSGGSLPVSNKVDDKFIKQTAEWLSANKGRALVVCGVNDVPTQLVVNEINKWLGSYGTTIDNTTSNNMRQGDDEQFASLVNDMKEGKVGAVLMYNCNPVYNTSAGLGFADALKKVALKVSFSGYADESSTVCDFICPDSHYLESWNDANPSGNHYSLGQPAIAPLFKTRQFQESLLLWSGNNAGYHAYIQKVWETKMFPNQKEYGDFVSFWNHSLHNGVFVSAGDAVVVDEKKKVTEEPKKISPKADSIASPMPEVNMSDAGMDLNGAATKIAAVKGGDLEVVLYEKAAIGDGSSTANNPWLVEFPDPISKVTWGNYVTMNPEDMRGKYGLLERQDRWGNTATLTIGKIVLENIPVFPQPGQTRGTVGVALGYGQISGKVAQMAEGFNAYPAVQWVNGTPQYYVTGASLSESTGKHEFACTQQQHTMMGRKIVNETDLKTYQEKPAAEWNVPTVISTINKDGHHEKKGPDQVTLWDEHPRPGHFWSMGIDLNSCIGCGACVIACHVENNVPVVGKDQIARTRDLHWLRIDRYFSSPMSKEKGKEGGLGKIDMYLQMEFPDMENPKVVFQPMMCQHCDNAPCETVCPVLATNHSAEGLNMMTYNRCIGTRYCANNCPFKVRRFNWYNYTGKPEYAEINPAHEDNDLGRMVLNPDVVVRSRGVMEKCSMCVQRIQEGKLDAKKAGKKVVDGEIQTACSQSCPTHAITFGDLNNPESAVSKMYQDERVYKVLDDVGVQPTVFYLTKVRNDNGEVKI